MMLVGAVIFGGGCGDGNSKSNQQSAKAEQGAAPVSALSVDSWAEVLEQSPDPKVVTDADLLKRIVETKLPWRVRDKKSGMEMLLVPPGKFVMGMSPGDEEGVVVEEIFAEKFPQLKYSERPAHEVTITKAFYLGKTEVTQEQWVKVMKSNPSYFSDANLRDAAIQRDIDAGLTKQEAQAKLGPDVSKTLLNPVEQVSWDDCQKFCAATGLRLPTEAEWEYACRAGVRKPRYGELAAIAWDYENSAETTHPVGKKLPNALGFHDTLGNVWEWCNDYFQGDYYKECIDGVVDPKGPSRAPFRVLRGGSWSVLLQVLPRVAAWQPLARRRLQLRRLPVCEDSVIPFTHLSSSLYSLSFTLSDLRLRWL